MGRSRNRRSAELRHEVSQRRLKAAPIDLRSAYEPRRRGGNARPDAYGALYLTVTVMS